MSIIKEVTSFRMGVVLAVLISFVAQSTGQDSFASRCSIQYPCSSCNYHWAKHATDCSKYYRCYSGKPYLNYCPSGTVFSMSWKTCTSAKTAFDNCSSSDFPTRILNDGVNVGSKPIQSSCGVKVEANIIGGLPATNGEWPWMVSLQTNGWHFCGASLLGDEWVLTAGHCAFGKSPWQINVVLGAHRLYTSSSSVVTRGVERIITHPYYSHGNNFPYDLALMKLSSPVRLSVGGLHPVCLPESNDLFTDKDDCWITGWGETRGTGDSFVLNELNIKLTDLNKCRQNWGSNIEQPLHICLGDGTSGSCLGDSGGPLVCRRNGVFMLAGSTSWGQTSCQMYGYPSVYAKVSPFVDWIKDTMFANK